MRAIWAKAKFCEHFQIGWDYSIPLNNENINTYLVQGQQSTHFSWNSFFSAMTLKLLRDVILLVTIHFMCMTWTLFRMELNGNPAIDRAWTPYPAKWCHLIFENDWKRVCSKGGKGNGRFFCRGFTKNIFTLNDLKFVFEIILNLFFTDVT